MQTDVGGSIRAGGAGPRRLLHHAAQAQSDRRSRSARRVQPSLPILLATILAAQVQEHERSFGGWQAEWQTFPALALVTSGALSAIGDIAKASKSMANACAPIST